MKIRAKRSRSFGGRRERYGISLKELAHSEEPVGIDVETTGFHPFGEAKADGSVPDMPFSIAFKDLAGNEVYFRWYVNPMNRAVTYDERDLEEIGTFMRNKKVPKVFWNAGFDMKHIWKGMGIPTFGPVHDACLMLRVATGGGRKSYKLKPASEDLLGYPQEDQDAVRESAKEARDYIRRHKLPFMLGDKPESDYWLADPKLNRKYNMGDSERTVIFYDQILPLLKEKPSLYKTYLLEKSLIRVVERMERRGVDVKMGKLKELRKYYEAHKSKQTARAKKLLGREINLGSSVQLAQAFTDLKIPFETRRNGNAILDKDAMEPLVNKYPMARAVIEYRSAQQMTSYFLKVFDERRVKEKNLWILNPNYNQYGTITGRFTCANPNLMAISSPDSGRCLSEAAQRTREALGPRPGHIWYMPDYSQIEVWIFAFLAQEPGMMKLLINGGDFHGAVAEQCWKAKDPNWNVKKKIWRNRAKLVLFGKMFGAGVKRISILTASSRAEAREFLGDFNDRFPRTMAFQKRAQDEAERLGYVEDVYGRRYAVDRHYGYRATNYLVQGPAAGVLKRAMVRIDKMLRNRWERRIRMLLTEHDELFLEGPLDLHRKFKDEIRRDIVKAMQGQAHRMFGMPRPFGVGIKETTTNWGEAKKVEL